MMRQDLIRGNVGTKHILHYLLNYYLLLTCLQSNGFTHPYQLLLGITLRITESFKISTKPIQESCCVEYDSLY